MTIIKLYHPEKSGLRLAAWFDTVDLSAVSRQPSAFSYELIGRQPGIHWRSQSFKAEG
jgi:hypothetical protein